MKDSEVQALADALRADIDEIAEQIGRPLSDSEKEGIAAIAFECVQRGEDFDPDRAVNVLLSQDEASTPRRDFAADLEHDCDQLERDLGRKLLTRERKGIEENARRQVGRYDRIDAVSALEDYYRDIKEDPLDLDKPADRDRYMVERLKDQDPDPGPDPDRVFDLTNDKDFSEYAKYRLAGHEFEDDDGAEPDGTDEANAA